MEHSLSSYTIRCHNPDSKRGTEESYHSLDKIGSYDLFILLQEFTKSKNNYSIVEGSKSKQAYKFTDVKYNPKSRVITGWIEYGHYGRKSSIINITNSETEFQKKPQNADMLSYFFLFWIPKEKEGIFLFHTIKSEGAKSIFQGEFTKYITRYIQRNLQYIPLAYDKAVQEWSNAEIKEIRAVRLKSPSDRADIPLSFANSYSEYTIKPLKNKKLPRFHTILDKNSEEAKLIYDLESMSECVKVSLTIDGKTRTFHVGNKSKTTLCEVIFPDTIKIIDGNPEFESVYTWANQILGEYKKNISIGDVMSAKINIMKIISGHYKTLTDTNKVVSISDIFSFLAMPVACSIVAYLLNFKSTNDTISLAVNFGAIFTALLMSVLVLVYDQQNKVHDRINAYIEKETKAEDIEPTLKHKLTLMRELYFNISYCIIISILLVIASSINSIFITIQETTKKCPEFVTDINYILLTPIIIFIASHLLITILMVVKRLHNLLVSE